MKKQTSTYSLLLAMCFVSLSSVPMWADTIQPNIDGAVQEFLDSQWGRGNVEWIPYGKQRDFKKYDEYEVRIRENVKPRGKTILQIELIKERRIERVIPYRIEIIAFADIPILCRDYDRNQELVSTDIRWERRDVSNIRSEWIDVNSEFLKESTWTRKRMKKGEVLFTKNVEKKPQVVMGDPVTIMVSNGSVNLRVPGIARQNGMIGDIIKVVNIQYNNILRARVKDEALVVLEHGSI